MRFDSIVTAFLLKQQQLGEIDILATWYSKELGKLRTIVTGARRPTSRLAHALQPAALVEVRLVGRNSEQGLLKLAGVNAVHYKAKELTVLQAFLLTWFLEVIAKSTPDAETNERLFVVSERFLSSLGGAATASGALALALHTFIVVLDALGVAIHQDVGVPAYFSVRAGGFFFQKPHWDDVRPVDSDLWHEFTVAQQELPVIPEVSTVRMQKQLLLLDILEAFLEYHLERGIRSYVLLSDIIRAEL